MKCKKQLITDAEIKKVIDEPFHNHEPDPEKLEALKKRAQLRKDAKQSSRPTSALVGDCLKDIKLSTRLQMGSLPAIKRATRRQKGKKFPADAKSISDFVIKEDWVRTNGDDGEKFLIFDSGNILGKKESIERVVIFATPTTLQHLAAAKSWYMDGTFKTAPSKLFTQNFIIRAECGVSAVTCVYALVRGKSEQIYTQMFRGLKEYVGHNFEVRTEIL